MGRTSYVEADIAKGRLVVPFKITLPADAGFYLVSPETRADPPKLRAFRQWLKTSMQGKA
jgi:LysR family glycine cleavage system transcriptional activator